MFPGFPRKRQQAPEACAADAIAKLAMDSRNHEELALNYKRLFRTLFFSHMEQSLKLDVFLDKHPEHRAFFNAPLEQHSNGFKNRKDVKQGLLDYASNKGWHRKILERLHLPL